MNRRDFLRVSSSTGAASVLAGVTVPTAVAAPQPAAFAAPVSTSPPPARLPALDPARWIWLPSERTLPCTFVLFRREVTLAAPPRRATGWIAADSRYRLDVNGVRQQWGPAPADPRWLDADPLDLTAILRAGANCLAATVLYYGHGDGTWPIGKPGFLFWLEIELADGRLERVVSDAAWQTHLCRAWRPGRPKRWYLRALQEEFDARRYPFGWNEAAFTGRPGDWRPAMELAGSPNKPALSTSYYEYTLDVGGGPADTELRPRSIPLLRESLVPVARLNESFFVNWAVSPEDYFDFRTPGAFTVDRREPAARAQNDGSWLVNLDGERGVVLTFELTDQVVGWPYVTVEAPAGTVVELLVHEAHAPDGPPLLNTHFDSWTRFICRAGVNRFETFDFESLRWLQLHIHGAQGPVRISQPGVRRRVFPWPNEPRITCSEPALQRLFDASINTLHNCAQETLVDGMARERQQYSGDGGHQLHAVHLAFGETRLPARFVTTFSQGLTKDGFFLDCWPAYDRLARLVQRQLDLSGWGLILDHGVGFNFDCWHHWQYSGDFETLREPYPRLLRFAAYLRGLVGRDGLLPVEDLGIPSVWIDHVAYQRQRHKQCAFNLYAAAMLEHALAPVAAAFGDVANARTALEFGRQLRAATVKRFWSAPHGTFVNNLPWLAEEPGIRRCDRSLATAILFDQCPGGRTRASLQALADCPPDLGVSYPCNAGWRLWALARGGRSDVILKDFRLRWATMRSVIENNTLQEDWEARPDSGQQWSHCAVAPLYVTFMGLAGLRPLTPGFGRVELRPLPLDLAGLEFTVHTVKGPIAFASHNEAGHREVRIALPPECTGEVVLPRVAEVRLAPVAGRAPAGHLRFRIPAGQAVTLNLPAN